MAYRQRQTTERLRDTVNVQKHTKAVKRQSHLNAHSHSRLSSTTIIYSSSLSNGLTPIVPPLFRFFSISPLNPNPFLFLTSSDVEGQYLIGHMVDKEVGQLQCNWHLMSSTSQGENKEKKGAASSKARRHFIKKKKQSLAIIHPSSTPSISLLPFFLTLDLSPWQPPSS